MSEAELAIEALTDLGIVLVSSRELADRALGLAIGLDHPAHDCFYMALAESRGIPMFTQDAKFMRKVRANSVSIAKVRLLGSEIS